MEASTAAERTHRDGDGDVRIASADSGRRARMDEAVVERSGGKGQ